MVDYWTFGCLIYEMLMGFPPFSSSQNRNQKALFDAITRGEFKLTTRMDEDAKDLIKRLLVTDVPFDDVAYQETRLQWHSRDQEPSILQVCGFPAVH